MKYADFEFGKQNLKFWDENAVILQEFKPEGTDKVIRFFRKNGFTKWDKAAKIISRSGFASFREPFIIEPWNQILIDEANVYGSAVDNNKEEALRGMIKDDQVMLETRMSVAKIMKEEWIWVARGQMVCHPESLIYGEIDEIWYEPSTDTYFVGDTKTSSSVDKIGYWYQLGIYIEILKALNPDKNISPIGTIDWTKIKKEKWVFNRNFNEAEWAQYKDDTNVTSEHPAYRAKWNEKTPLTPPEEINLLVKRNLDIEGVLDLAKADINLIRRYKISSVDIFNDLLNTNEEFNTENNNNQNLYDAISKRIKG